MIYHCCLVSISWRLLRRVSVDCGVQGRLLASRRGLRRRLCVELGV